MGWVCSDTNADILWFVNIEHPCGVLLIASSNKSFITRNKVLTCQIGAKDNACEFQQRESVRITIIRREVKM